MKHLLITQWNCDIFDIDWLQRRQKVFEKFCLPGVEAQKNQDFEWLMVSDSRTPDKFKNVLESYPATVIYPDFENHVWDDHAPPCDDLSAIMKRSTQLEYISNFLIDHIGTLDTDYVITSRCDNDDVLAFDHIDRIQTHAKDFRRLDDEFWFSLIRGMQWSHGYVYPHNSLNNAFLSFVEHPENLKTCYQVCHTLASKTDYPVHGVRSGSPTWLQVVHDENLLNKVKRQRGKAPDSTIRDRFTFND